MNDKASSKKQSFSIISTILLVLLFVLTLFFYEYWQGTTIFNQIKTWLLSLMPPVGITINYSVNSSAKKPPVSPPLVYTNAKYIFSFSYPETLDLYHESSDEDLETFYKEEKYKPLAKLFFEEKTTTTESNSNSRSLPLPLSFLSLFGVGNSSGTGKDPSGYTFNVSLNSKSSSESVSDVALNSKENLCRTGVGQADIIMTQPTTVSVPGIKFVCDGRNFIYIFVDPRNKRQFFRIEAELRELALEKKPVFLETLNKILDSFSFNISPNQVDSPTEEGKAGYTFADAQKMEHLHILRASISLYFAEKNKFPSKLEELVPNYLKSMVNDPVTNLPFSYQLLSGGTDYKICLNFDSTAATGVKGINCFFSPK